MASLVLNGNTSGSVTISSPAVSGTNTITLPAATGTSVLTNVTGNVDINAAGSNYVTLSTNTTERMRIDSSGNVGIGVTPSAWGSNFKVIESAGNSSAVYAGANINGLRLTSNLYNDNTNFIYKTTGEAAVYSINTSIHQWYTAPSGTAGTTATLTERMRIDSSGNVQIATTSQSNGAVLTVAGTVSASLNGRIYSLGTYNNTTASGANMHIATDGHIFRSTSSIKYKTNVQNAIHGLDKVMELRPVTYKGINDGDIVFGGLIAEEVHDAGLTEFVQYAEDGSPDALAYGQMVALAFKAIQEQQTIINDLKTRIETLEAK